MKKTKRNGILAAIHIKKAAMNFPDDLYRGIIFDNFKKNSAKELGDAQLCDLLNILEYIQTGKPFQPAHMINRSQMSYLNDLCYRNNINVPTAYISKIIHREILDIMELTKIEAGKVIRKLQSMSRAKNKKKKTD